VTASVTTVDGTDTVTLTATVSNDKSTSGTADGVSWSVSGGGALSNATTTSATYTAPAATASAQTVTVTATSVADTTKTGSVTLTVAAKPAITAPTSAQLTGAVGSAYSLQLAGTGGIAPYTWTLTAGTLPTGWTLTTGGLLSGPAPVAGQAGSFSLTFKMTDAGTPTALTDSVQVTVTINPAPAITFSGTLPATATYNTAYTGSSAASGGAGTLTYSLTSGSGPLPGGLSLNASTGAVTGTPTTPGTFNFTIQAADAYGDSATQAYTITVSKATPTLAFAAIPAKTYGDAAFTVSATSASTGAITYSVASGPATINSSTGLVTITGAGTVALGVSQAATTNYTAATASTSFTVNKAAATINVTPYTVTYDGAAHTATATVTGVGGASLPVADVTLTGTTHTNAGTYASDAWSFTDASGNYNDASGTVSDKINQAAATVNVTAYTVTYDGTAHTATATATGIGGAALPNSDFTLTGTAHTNAGTYNNDAWSFADTNYVSQSGTASDTINQATAIVNVTPYTVTYDGTAHTAAATATGVGGASLPATDFTLTGTAHTNAGTYNSDAWSFADQNYVSQGGTVSDTINQATAIVSVTPYTVTYDGNPHTATATATGVSGASLPATDFTLTGTTHTNAGAYDSDAWSFADQNYVSQNGTVSDTISVATPALAFTAIPTHTYGDAAFAAHATSASSGAITYSVTSGPANIDPSTGLVTITGVGSVTLSASQAASGNYGSATASITFTVNGAAPGLSFAAISNKVYGAPPAGDAPFDVSATSASAGAITYSVASGPATISGSTVTLTGSGTVNLHASQAANGNYAAATADTSFIVNPTLSIATTALPTGVVGTAYSQQLQGTGGNGTYSWATDDTGTSNLKALGLSLYSTGLVTGATPILGGPSSFTVTLSDGNGHTAQSTLSVTVSNIAITTDTLPIAYTGASYSQQLTSAGGAGGNVWSVSVAGNLSTYGLTLSSSGLLSGTIPSNAATGTGVINFTAQVKDSNNLIATKPFSISVYGPLTLPTASTLHAAIIGADYGVNNVGISASGGSGSYSFAVNGTSIPTNGTATTIASADSLTGWNSGSNTLSLGGTPLASETITLNVTVTDTGVTPNTTYGPIAYTIVAAPQQPLALPDPSTYPLQTSVNVNQSYYAGLNATGGANGVSYSFTVQIGGVTTTVPTDNSQVTLTNGNGLTANNSGGSTLTISGTPTTAGSITLLVTVSDSASDTPASQSYTINVVNPTAGYNVSGTVSYSGTKTGWIYLQLKNDNCDSCGHPGIAIPAKEAYSIKGVQAGTYELKAYMDPFNYGAENASDPVGSASNITVSSSDVSGANVTLGDPGTITLSTTPTISVVGTFATGAFVQLGNLPTNSDNVEKASSYTVRWSSDSFSTYTEKSFPAIGGDNTPFIVSGLTNGHSYSFKVQAVAGSSTSDWSAATTAVTIANTPASGNNAVSGTVTFPTPAGGITGPLYVGFYDQSTGKIYATVEANPVSPQSYSLYVPTGTNYFLFGIVDNNNSGVMSGAGQVSNTNEQSSTSVAINGTANEDLTLPTNAAGTAPKNSVARVTTQHNQQINSGGTNDNYNIEFRVDGLYKLPVNVELATKPAASAIVAPSDWATGAFNNNVDEFQFSPNLNGGTLQVGDAYDLLVTYSDSTSETLSVSVSAVLDALATLNTPAAQATGVSATPNFNWTDPANSGNYTYQFQLQDSSYNTIWKIPSDHSNSDGFSNATTSITWGTDPTGNSITPTVSSLDSLSTYYWSIQATDASGNSAQEQVSFETGESPLTLPDNSKPGSALINQAYSQSLNASGGSGSYTWQVTGLSDNLTYSTNGNTLTISGTPSIATTVNFTVTVTDANNTSDSVSKNYSITVINGPNGAHNSYLNGRYVCKTDGFNDSDGARWTSLGSFQANGATATITSGIWDMNGRDQSSGVAGTVTGTYSIGADNNGMVTMNSVQTTGGTGSQSMQYAIALTNAVQPAQEFRMVETDDVGSSASGMHATADCYLATTGAFASSTFDSKSFAFGMQGENGNGIPKAYVGRFSASGGNISNGILDGMRVDQTSDNSGAFTGTYTAPDSTTGRFTFTITPSGGGGSITFASYIIDAKRMFQLETAGDSGLLAGEMRAQQQNTYTGANLSGNFVLYSQSFRYSNGGVSGYDANVFQGTGDGTGKLTINQSYQNDQGSYKSGKANGGPVLVTFDTTYAGRSYFSPENDTVYLYFFDNNSAFELDPGSNYLQTGWVEPQTQTIFTNEALKGSYLFGQMPPMQANQHANVGEFILNDSNGMTGSITDAGQGEFSYAQSMSMNYAWSPASSNTTGTFLVGTTDNGGSCAVISATRAVCENNADSSPAVLIFQQ
jgi:hypothetical protein